MFIFIFYRLNNILFTNELKEQSAISLQNVNKVAKRGSKMFPTRVGKYCFFLGESFFEFVKMDKKNVQFLIAEILL